MIDTSPTTTTPEKPVRKYLSGYCQAGNCDYWMWGPVTLPPLPGPDRHRSREAAARTRQPVAMSAAPTATTVHKTTGHGASDQDHHHNDHTPMSTITHKGEPMNTPCLPGVYAILSCDHNDDDGSGELRDDYPISVRVHAFDDNGAPLVIGHRALVTVEQLAADLAVETGYERPHFRLTELDGDEAIEVLEQRA